MDTAENQELVKVLPPREVLEDGGIFLYGDPIIRELQISNYVTRLDFPEEGGMLVYHEGDKYPAKGLPFREAVLAADVAKRSALNIVRFLASSPVRYFLPFALLLPGFVKKAILRSAIERYCDLTDTMFVRTSAYIKPQYFCTMAREIHRVGMEIAGDDEAMKRFVMTVCMVFEYDDAYRYRMQDIFGEIDRERLLTSPASELSRVFKIGAERGSGTAEKFGDFARLIPFLFWIGSIRRPLMDFFASVDLDNLKLDDVDWYRCLIWGGYKFRGVPDDQRVSMRMMIDADWLVTDPTVKASKPEPEMPVDQNSTLSFAT